MGSPVSPARPVLFRERPPRRLHRRARTHRPAACLLPVQHAPTTINYAKVAHAEMDDVVAHPPEVHLAGKSGVEEWDKVKERQH